MTDSIRPRRRRAPLQGGLKKVSARARKEGAGEQKTAKAGGASDTTAKLVHLKPKDIARRTFEKLGQRIALQPAPEVPVDKRAGKTAALRLGQRSAQQVFAAIDLGSSSAKMLVARLGADGKMRTVLDEKIGAALGKGVNNGEAIPDANQQRALKALAQFIDDAAKLGVKAADIPMITTAVVRNSTNGDDLVRAIRELGLARVKVLAGDDEAGMGFRGALVMMNGAPGRYATLDLGGGSFQLAVGTEKGVEDGGSTQVGSNIILDTLLAPAAGKDAPTLGAGHVADFAAVDKWLAHNAPLPLDAALLSGRTLVATGGVSKFLRAHFNRDVITRADIDALRKEIIVLPYDARIPLVQSGKDATTQKALGVDTAAGALDYGKKLPASASLLLRILDGLGVDEVRVSETDARHALIAARAKE